MNKDSSISDEDFDELRRLLVGPELEKLERISKRVESPEQFSSDVGEILPQAMLKSAEQGEQLSKAMIPTVEEIVRLSIKRDINKFAEALFPVIGPAIRKSISETFRQMLQSLNQALDNSLSWQGIKWRIESMRTGIPFAEIVLLNGLVFRVEQVFLIHRETSLLLQHVERTEAQNQNPDLVSSMLSAIVDFVGDSFEVEKNQALDSIQVGDLSIWIERGSDVILALAIRGDAPNSLRQTMQQTLQQVQSRYERTLIDFNGDIMPFESSEGLLIDCLQTQYKTETKKIKPKTILMAILILLLVLYWIVFSIYQSMLHDDYVTALKSEPGYVITRVENQRDGLVIEGLRDPLARDPELLLNLTTLDPDSVFHRFEPYQSLSRTFVHRRLVRQLKLPQNVSMHNSEGVIVFSGYASSEWITRLHDRLAPFTGLTQFDTSKLHSEIDLSVLQAPQSVNLQMDLDSGRLTVSGEASTAWAQTARTRAATLQGVRVYDDSALQEAFDYSVFSAPDGVSMNFSNGLLRVSGRAQHEWIAWLRQITNERNDIKNIDLDGLIDIEQEALAADIAQLESVMIFFDTATSFNLDSGHALEQAVNLTASIIRLAATLSRSITILIEGHSDSIGLFEDNVYLSIQRADFVAQYLFNRGINPRHILIKGIDAPVKKENSLAERNYNRRVNFKVAINNQEH